MLCVCECQCACHRLNNRARKQKQAKKNHQPAGAENNASGSGSLGTHNKQRVQCPPSPTLPVLSRIGSAHVFGEETRRQVMNIFQHAPTPGCGCGVREWLCWLPFRKPRLKHCKHCTCLVLFLCCIVATTLYYLLTPDCSSPRIPSCTTRDASTAFELGLNLLCLPVVVGRRVQLSLSRVLMRRLYTIRPRSPCCI